jgi:cyclophilin family peptidyl-prolyl cis-trans isomerase
VLALSVACARAPRTISEPDSDLVYAILTAEDRRNPTADALTQGLTHPDERIRTLARRARDRVRDARFTSRDSFPALVPPRTWPEPAWRLRHRALASQRTDCAALRAALGDSALPVRLRASDLLPEACGADEAVVATLRSWIEDMPVDVSRRERGRGSWHEAAHATVALARLRTPDARMRIKALATHSQWQLRMYAARAAGLASDTAAARALARDDDDNVKEAAIESLARLTGHADDELFLRALHSRGAQAVRAAAIALKGSERPGVRTELRAAFDRFITRANESERDARVALLEAMGRSAADDRPPGRRAAVPRSAIGLAVGEDVRLRVTMSPGSGGGSFVVRLRGDVAPIMASRVLELARAGYYNGTTWHRVEHDFVVQGGGHGANEYVGYNEYFRDEVGTVPHVRGTVGMSTRGHDTGDAQWFINLRDNLRLGRDYTVFAEVVEGIEVVDDILEGDVILKIEPVEN